jgi:hypothetical protein
MASKGDSGLLLLGLSFFAAAAVTNAAAQDVSRGLEPLLKVASAMPFGAERGLGSPVVFSRTDVETPLTRIRSLSADPGAPNDLGSAGANTEARAALADPAFKSVLLTPRGSTGRPVQPTYEPPPEVAVPVGPATAPRQEASLPPATRHEIKPLPQMRHEPSPLSVNRPNIGNQRSAPAARPKPAPVATARREGPKGGPAEIAATRAFTRF